MALRQRKNPSVLASNRERAFVIVKTKSAAQGEHLCADIDDGITLRTGDVQALALFDQLFRRLKGCCPIVDESGITAATLASLTEAYSIRPRVSSWIPEAAVPGKRYRLPRPREINVRLATALERRRSVRQFAGLRVGVLSTLLFHSARVRE